MRIEVQSRSDLDQKIEISDINQFVAISVVDTKGHNPKSNTIFLNDVQIDELINGLVAARNTAKGVIDGE